MLKMLGINMILKKEVNNNEKGGQNVDKLSFSCFKVKDRKGLGLYTNG